MTNYHITNVGDLRRKFGRSQGSLLSRDSESRQKSYIVVLLKLLKLNNLKEEKPLSELCFNIKHKFLFQAGRGGATNATKCSHFLRLGKTHRMSAQGKDQLIMTFLFLGWGRGPDEVTMLTFFFFF